MLLASPTVMMQARTTRRHRNALLLLAVLLMASITLWPRSDVGAQSAGSVRGTVKVARAPAAPAPLPVSAQLAGNCGRTVPNDELVVGQGGVLANAVVWLDNVQAPQGARPRDVTLTNDSCRFTPHVQTATVGANLALTSRDAFLHNTHGYLGTRTIFNLAIPMAGMTVRRPLGAAGRMTVKCDVHSWMLAHVHVFPHPYHAVTGRNGTFEIPGVPPGTYPVKVWHERLGDKNASVTVTTAAATVDINY